MYLKTLTLRGFKSFASSTTLRFEPGITAVVGPNGSGKSNVVDALTWVMGEQGAKSLRGAKMVDVIFAGTSLRPALGRAEVSLTIDNSDGLLPIEYTEVTITRTMFRGGGSEYSINGSPVRLLDIQELLSDTGMGKQMHVVVGQGRLDEILSASALERRGFIEESAGVLKHRRRKERALAKLESMSGKVARVHDLAQELKRQIGPLSRQAKAARKAARIQAQIKDARSRLLASEIALWKERLTNHTSGVNDLKEQRSILKEQQALQSQQLREYEDSAAKTRDLFDQVSRAFNDLNAVNERTQSLLALAQERLQSLQSKPFRTGADPAALEQKSAAAEKEYEDLNKQIDELRIQLADALLESRKADAIEISAANEFNHLSQLKSKWRDDQARLRGEVSQAGSRLESANANASRLAQELSAAKARLESAETELANFEPTSESEQSVALKQHDQAMANRDNARAELDRLLAEERDLRDTIARWQARAEALSQAVVPDDSTADLLNCEYTLGQLSQLCVVEPGWEVAIAAALHPFAEAGFAQSLPDAMLAVQSVPGAARSLYVPTEGEDAPPLRSAAGSGKLRWAKDLVDSQSAQLNAVLKAALRMVAVVDSDDEAAIILSDFPSIEAVVSRAGTVFTHYSVWKPGEGGANYLALKAQLEKAQQEATKAQARLDKHASILNEAKVALDTAIKDANTAIKQLRLADSEAAEVAAKKLQMQTARRMAAAEFDRVEKSAQMSAVEVKERTQQLAEAESKLQTFLADSSEPDVTKARSAMDEASAQAKHIHDKQTDLRLSLAALEERVNAAGGRAKSLRRAARQERQELALQAREQARRKLESKQVSQVISQTQALLKQLQVSVSQASAERAEISQRQQQESGSVHEYRKQIERSNQRLDELTEAIHRDEVAYSEIRLQLDNAIRMARMELNMEPAELLEQFGPDKPVPEWVFTTSVEPLETDAPSSVRAFDVTEVEAAWEAAKHRLERLGKVNPLALEEYQAVNERYEYITKQLADLEQSKQDLLQIVKEVDKHVLEVFESAFKDTANAFREVFATLFPGGEGRLVLTDPQDLLNTGIEVQARPAGKKVSRLSLLSGGERSLVAIAMLVAIFIARPSPFYVMDEVEAALDDTNLGRLLRIFQRLRQNSQLIVITHQKRTMEVADALYGITMRDGVTKVVSQRLEGQS